MKNIRVRFNLGRGENYLKWKVEYPNGRVQYHDPCMTQLIMKNCILKNRRSTAEKIFNGENKTVCSWVTCETLIVRHDPGEVTTNNDRLRYNPRANPYWTNENGEDVDNEFYKELTTNNRNLFVTKF
jgi:hypothetical protein